MDEEYCDARAEQDALATGDRFLIIHCSTTFHSSGHLGTMWLQFPMDSQGDQLFQTTLLNATLVPQINIDAEAACDPEKNFRITEFHIPILYDGVVSNFDNLDTAFETIIQGIVIFIVESQNILLESTFGASCLTQ